MLGMGQFNQGPSDAELIESFVSHPSNDFHLRVGEDHMSTAAQAWLPSGKGTVYNRNPEVITVTKLGKVTAVAPGIAYIAITPNQGGVYQIVKYIVTE